MKLPDSSVEGEKQLQLVLNAELPKVRRSTDDGWRGESEPTAVCGSSFFRG